MTPMTALAAARGRDRTIGMATFATADPGALEPVFGEVPGVLASGVVRLEGRTALRVEFDPTFVSYEQLLETFWDRVERARAGRRAGPAVLVHSSEQEQLALAALEHRRKAGCRVRVTVVRAGRCVGRL